MRRYGDGLFGVVLVDACRIPVGIDRLDVGWEGLPVESARARVLTLLIRRGLALLMLFMVNLDRAVQFNLVICMYPSFTPHCTVSGNLPDPGYLKSHDDDLAHQPHSATSFV